MEEKKPNQAVLDAMKRRGVNRTTLAKICQVQPPCITKWLAKEMPYGKQAIIIALIERYDGRFDKPARKKSDLA